jgi:hypothetical protein
MNFPQYRKLSGGLKYYRITSPTEWEEVYFIGKKRIIKSHIAQQLPERNFIADLLYFREGNAESITEEEYLAFIQ